MEGSKRDGRHERWQAFRARRQERRAEIRRARRAAIKRLGARVTGFLRFYGGKLLRGGARIRSALGSAARVHRSRTYAQRLWFGLAFAGIAAWAVVGLDLVPRFFQPPLPVPEFGVEPGVPLEAPGGVANMERSPVAAADETPVALPELLPQARAGASDGGEERADATGLAAASGASGEYAPVIAQVPAVPVASVDSMVWPAVGEITRSFGWHRHPVFNDWRYSPGVAIQPLEGDGTVRAALAGRVKDVVNEGGLWRISVEHAGGWITEYEGLTEVYVDSLAVVATGQPVGTAEGGLPSGLFFAVRQGEEAVDPSSLVSRSVSVASLQAGEGAR